LVKRSTLVLALAIALTPTGAQAGPITLPLNEIAVLTYSGYETFHDLNRNRIADPGDLFTGIIQVQSIKNAAGTSDLSGQLATKELTGAFSFHVTGGSSPSGHIEFGLAPGDFFSLFVGTGATKNYDPSAPDAVARATDGQPWLSVLPGAFFVSVNDLIGGQPVNRAWADVSANDTGYGLAAETFLDLLGKPSSNTYGGVTHGDYASQIDFENHSARSDLPGYTFKISGFVFVEATPAPEPASLTLLGLGSLGLLGYGWKRRKPATA
jgi:hypothetical protein